MKTLFKKELSMAIPPFSWLFLLFPALALIPSYPLVVSVGYVFLGIFIVGLYARENKDVEFTMMLPVSRERVATAKTLVILLFETATLIVAVPFIVINALFISPEGNMVGVDPNITFFGMMLIAFAAGNLVLIPWQFKRGFKHGLPVLCGVITFAATYVIQEIILQVVPSVREIFDSVSGTMMGYQAIYLAVGLALFALSSWMCVKLACKNFRTASI